MIWEPGPPPYYRFASIPPQAAQHAVFTRLGGASQGFCASLNVGRTVGDDPAHVEANHAAIYAAFGIEPAQVVCGRQVHGDHVARVTHAHGGQVLPATDALITDAPGLALMLRFADCTPVLLAAPRVGAVGLAHAGWRGTVARIAAKTALAMVAAFGCRPDEILAGIGPAIGPCCYEVGPEVEDAVRATFPGADELFTHPTPGGRAHLDLWAANALQLREVGVTQVECAALCTACQRHVFYSHRADGGRTGRFAALIAPTTIQRE